MNRKMIFRVFSVMALAIFIFTACKKKEDLLIHKWRYEKLESKLMDQQIAQQKEMIKQAPDSLRPELEKRIADFELMLKEGMKKSTMDMQKGGIFVSDNMGVKSDGKWSLTKDKKVLVLVTNTPEGEQITDSLEIQNLTDKELKLKSKKEGDDGILTLVPYTGDAEVKK